jgi:hypothetical protein
LIQKVCLKLDDKVSQVEGLIVSDMNGEKVMLSIENGKYYNLGEVGGYIWDRIKKPILIKDIIKNLILEYRVEKVTCKNDVLQFLNLLFEQDLIRVIS